MLHLSREEGRFEAVYFTDEDGKGKTDELQEDYPDWELDWEVEIHERFAVPCTEVMYEKHG
jgi:hypothetical protein